jgi:hypothetical protein
MIGCEYNVTALYRCPSEKEKVYTRGNETFYSTDVNVTVSVKLPRIVNDRDFRHH